MNREREERNGEGRTNEKEWSRTRDRKRCKKHRESERRNENVTKKRNVKKGEIKRR